VTEPAGSDGSSTLRFSGASVRALLLSGSWVVVAVLPMVAVTASAQVDTERSAMDGGGPAQPTAPRIRTDAGPADAAPPAPLAVLPEGGSSQNDVVEAIVPTSNLEGAAPTSEGAPRQEPEPVLAADRTTIAGWAKESTEWTLTSSGYRDADPDAADVPHDRLLSRTQLYLRASHVRGRWFEATVSGVLGYSLREEGPSGTSTFDGVNGQATSGDPEMDLRDLYVGFYSKYVDFRIGQQRVAWGRADLQSPNDVLNARDLRDPILTETELRHLPTPLLRLDLDLGAVNVQIVGTPVFVPDAYDVYGTNWSVIQQDSPSDVKAAFASVWPKVDPSKRAQFNTLVHDTELPASNWTAPSAGTKISTVVAGIDLDVYYHYGFDTTPYLSSGMSSFTALLGAPILATYVRRHHFGFDAAATAGPFVLRLDAAYDTQRVYYYELAFGSVASPTAAGVASIEYQTGDIDKVLLVEAIYNHLVDSPTNLLGYDRNSYALTGTFRWPMGGGIAADLRGLVGIEPVSFVLEPALRWKLNDALFFKVGAVLLGGEERSLGWYYRHNTSVFLQAKYSF
jgi:hypothetical protein